MAMIRYRLDDLGWYQFEWLVQSLLKNELGLSVESWGGRSDFGRDAYCRTSLNYPTDQLSNGPFLFQVKFVENANAAGAIPDNALRDAVAKEIAAIEDRRNWPTWEEPNFYTLVTNASVSAGLKEKIKNKIASVLPKATIIINQANDVCDLLDKHEKLRRAFPQLLSLRDLDHMLSTVLNKEALQRSEAAINCAKDVVNVFVPTRSYTTAWQILSENNFVVLHGPPEMGKTAIAWMIALTQAATGWDALICDNPDDFFRLYNSATRQIFVADDAFGRTEYDPTRGKQWERQLDRVIRMTDKNHWLIWTSRKHILERARHTMDLQGKAQGFPKPSDVIVDANELTTREKALMLFRHVRASRPNDESKNIITGFARSIVGHSSFTPERIRLFVWNVLPKLVEEHGNGEINRRNIWLEIEKAIRTPTDRMAKTFRGLTKVHKAILISLLEAGNYAYPEIIRTQFHAQTASSSPRLSFDEILDELSEAFVRRGHFISWMHPSYRDLIIDELARDNELRTQFLGNMSIKGIKLAISDTGGQEGQRRLPLVIDSKDWEMLRSRCIQISEDLACKDDADLLLILLEALLTAHETEEMEKLESILQAACSSVRNKGNSHKVVFSATAMRSYCQASQWLRPLPPLPNLEYTWISTCDRFRNALKDVKSNGNIDASMLELWTDLLTVIRENEPRFLTQIEIGFFGDFCAEIHELFQVIDAELSGKPDDLFHNELRDLSHRFERLKTCLERLEPFNVHRNNLQTLLEKLASTIEELDGLADELEPDYYDDRWDSREDEFNVENLFLDL